MQQKSVLSHPVLTTNTEYRLPKFIFLEPRKGLATMYTHKTHETDKGTNSIQ